MPNEQLPFFVYGTLMRGQERERFWPHLASSIETAFAQGALHHLGPYPAMVAGESWVCGELWTIEQQHLEATLRALDEVEDFDQGGVDLFKRTIIDCRIESGRQIRAYAYFYGNPAVIANRPIIEADEDGYCRWRR